LWLIECFKVRRRAVEYVDGVLPPREAEAVRAHLEKCPRCRKLVWEMLRVREVLSSLPTVRARPDFAEHVWRGIEARERRKPAPARLLWRLLLPIPALAVALALAFLLLFRAPSTEGPPVVASVKASEVHLAYEAAYPLSNIYAVGAYISGGSGEG